MYQQIYEKLTTIQHICLGYRNDSYLSVESFEPSLIRSPFKSRSPGGFLCLLLSPSCLPLLLLLLFPSPVTLLLLFPSPVPLLLLDLVQGFFGRGPFLGAGPGPRNLPSRPLQGISAGPGPRGKIGPRPNVVGTSSKRELDLVQEVSVCQKHPLCHTSSFRTTCSPGCMYSWNDARGRFRVHTPEGCATGACLPGCMYTWNAVRGQFRVHTPPQGSAAAEGGAAAQEGGAPAATREKKRPVEIDRTFLHDWSPGNGYLSLNSRRPPERRSA